MKKLFSIFAVVVTLAIFTTACKQPGNMSEARKAELEAVIKSYIIAHPEVLMQSLQSMKRQGAGQVDDKKTEAEIAKRSDELNNNPDSPFIGNPKGKTIIVEFFDYNCHYCKGVVGDLKKVVDENKDVKLVFKELPILGPTSTTTAIAALAVHDFDPKKYFAFHQALMAKQGAADDASIADAAKVAGVNVAKLQDKVKDKKYADQLAKNVDLAHALGISGTPTFIVNGKLVRGAVPYDSMVQIIAGKPMPPRGPAPAR